MKRRNFLKSFGTAALATTMVSKTVNALSPVQIREKEWKVLIPFGVVNGNNRMYVREKCMDIPESIFLYKDTKNPHKSDLKDVIATLNIKVTDDAILYQIDGFTNISYAGKLDDLLQSNKMFITPAGRGEPYSVVFDGKVLPGKEYKPSNWYTVFVVNQYALDKACLTPHNSFNHTPEEWNKMGKHR